MRTFAWIALVALVLAAPAAAEDEGGAADANADKYSAEELEEIVGPIALYPDIVISSVLPASAEPMDVVSAARWLDKQEGEVKGAPEDSTWADSVQALVQFPDVLIWMNENLDWMEELGYAVSVQQEEVMGAIQAFRKKSKDAGNLESNDKQVIVENNNIIEVQPADPQIVYVPQYNPVYVTQPVATYPPSYRGTFWAGFAAGALGAWAVHSIRWGGYHGGRYGGGGININHNPTYNFNKGGNINRGNTGAGKAYRPNRAANTRAGGGAPRGRGGVNKAKSPGWNNKRSKAKAPRGGQKAPSRRPSASRKGGSTRPGSSRPSSASKRPTKAPKVNKGGSGSRGNKSKPRTDRAKPSKNKSSFGGSNRSGSSARKSSSRGRSSKSRSKPSSSRSRSSGSSRSRSSGGSRGGGSRGGGGRRR